MFRAFGLGLGAGLFAQAYHYEAYNSRSSACCDGGGRPAEGAAFSSPASLQQSNSTPPAGVSSTSSTATDVLKPSSKPHSDVFSARFKYYQLGDVIPITHDVALFRFLLPHTDDEFNLRPCSTLQACYKYGVQIADQCQRFYTPVTPNHTKGYFDIIVKRKPNGKMTNHLFGMHIGDKLLFRSIGLKIQYRPNRWKQIGMIAGGTGFTPMLQVIRHSLTEPLDDKIEDHTKLSLLYCNRTEKHILLKGLFDQLAQQFKDRFRVAYVIDQALDKKAWKGYTGYVTAEQVKATMPPPDSPDHIIMVCGPDQLLTHVAGTPMGAMAVLSAGYNIQPIAADASNLVSLGGILADLGYDPNNVYRF